MFEPLTYLETMVINLQFESDNSFDLNIRSQLDCSMVYSRFISGVGFITRIAQSLPCENEIEAIIDESVTPYQSVYGEIDSLKDSLGLIGFIVFTKQEKIYAIEGHCVYKSWPSGLNGLIMNIKSKNKVKVVF